MLRVTTETRSLQAEWTYPNPPKGAVIDGYRVYIDSVLSRVTTYSATQSVSIEELTPFTNYTVEVSAFNTLENGTIQEGPRSDAVTEMTPADGRYYNYNNNITIVTGSGTAAMPLCKKVINYCGE